jgi:hypothetical protein
MCRGLASHVEQSKDEDTVTTSQHPPLPGQAPQPGSPPQQGSPTASMTTVRTSVSRESDRKPSGRKSTERPESLTMESLPNLDDDDIKPVSKVVRRKSADRPEALIMGSLPNLEDNVTSNVGVRVMGAAAATRAMGTTDSLRNQDGESIASVADHSPWANLQVHDAPRGKNNNLKGNFKDYGAVNNGRDNGIKGSGLKDIGRDNGRDNGIKGNGIKDNGRDNGVRGNGIKDNGINNGSTENGKNNGFKAPVTTDTNNAGFLASHHAFYTRDDHSYPTDGQWDGGQGSPRGVQNGDWCTGESEPVNDGAVDLDFDFRKDTHGGILQYCDGDLVMISNV